MGSAAEATWVRSEGVRKPWRHLGFRVLVLALGLIAMFALRLPATTRIDVSKDAPRVTVRNVAVIVEPRTTHNLVPLILHFGAVLGAAWHVVLYTDMDRWRMPKAHAFQRAVMSGQVQIRFLPEAANLTDEASMSRFLAKPWLWEQLRSSPRVLMFQKDSIICSNSTLAIENFLPYDFLGPPLAQGNGLGYSGGLSIRNPSMFLEIANESDFETDGDASEDEWFYKKLIVRSDATLPNEDVAKAFAVRTLYHDGPVGYLQPSRWQADKMDQIEEYCPEVRQLNRI